MSEKSCNSCKHLNDVVCTRTRKEIKGRTCFNPYTGEVYPVYNINLFDCPFISDERVDSGKLYSFLFGKSCGRKAIYHESK